MAQFDSYDVRECECAYVLYLLTGPVNEWMSCKLRVILKIACEMRILIDSIFNQLVK